MPLPLTATARRNARLRATAAASIPFLLFIVAAAPRVWEPDLVPFGRVQATYVAEAERQSPVTLHTAYFDPTVSPLALVEPALGYGTTPTIPWVVLRGLLDAVGVALLYLTARRLLDATGATLAALLYAVSPTAWALARDPAGSLGPVLTAATLFAGVRLAERPTLVRAALLGLLLGLMARSLPFGPLAVPLGAVALLVGRASWRVSGVAALALLVSAGGALFAWGHIDVGGSLTVIDPVAIQPMLALALAAPMMVTISAVRRTMRIGAVVLVGAGVVMTGSIMRADLETEWLRPAFTVSSPGLPGEERTWPQAGGSLAALPSYREVVALTGAMLESAGRADASEIVLLTSYLPESLTPFSYGGMLDDKRTPSYGENIVLPLEQESVFLASATGQRAGRPERAIEVHRPSSTIRVLTPRGADTGLELFTLRPRSRADWLASVQAIANGEFADGSRLVGVDAEPRANGLLDVALYWELAGPARKRSEADRVRVELAVAPTGAPTVEWREAFFPPSGERRDDHLLLMQVRLPGVPDAAVVGPLRLTLFDERLQSIRTLGGDVALEVPIRGLQR